MEIKLIFFSFSDQTFRHTSFLQYSHTTTLMQSSSLRIFELEVNSQAEIELKLPPVLKEIRRRSRNDHRMIHRRPLYILTVRFTNLEQSPEDYAFLKIEGVPANTKIFFYYNSKLKTSFDFFCRFSFYNVKRIRGLYIKKSTKSNCAKCTVLIQSSGGDMTIDNFFCPYKFEARDIWIKKYLSA